MATNKQFRDFVVEGLAPLGHVTSRNMFGGTGVYVDGAMMALLAYDELYFKTDDQNRAVFEDEGCEPFRYQKKDGQVAVMSYYKAPESVFDDPDEMVRWGRLGMEAAFRAK